MLICCGVANRIACIAVVLFLSACRITNLSQQAADSAVGRFYYFMSREEYDVIYRLSDSVLKSSVTEKELANMLKRVNRASKLCSTPVRRATTVTANLGGTFVSMANQRVCNKTLLDESFVFHISDGVAQLQMYRASGSALSDFAEPGVSLKDRKE